MSSSKSGGKYTVLLGPSDREDLQPEGGHGGGDGGAEGDAPGQGVRARHGGRRHRQGQGHPQGGGPAARGGQQQADKETRSRGNL